MFRRRSSEARIESELRDHLEQLVALHVASGLSPEEARRQAILEFGNPEAVRDAGRLGCARWRLVSSVARRVAISTAIGLAGGLLVVVAIPPSIAPMLTEVHVVELSIYLGAASLILTVCAAALAIPLRRAVSTDPAAALRHE